MKTKKSGYWIHYPKLILLILSFIFAYIIFQNQENLPLYSSISSSGLIGVFIVGMFFTFGFTSAPAAVLFLLMAKNQPIFLAAIVGGIGALIGDLFMFSVFRYSLADEIKMLEKERVVRGIEKEIPVGIKYYLLPIIAGFVIASPLPDEIGVLMFASFTRIKPAVFSVLSFLLNTLGIFVLLVVGKAI